MRFEDAIKNTMIEELLEDKKEIKTGVEMGREVDDKKFTSATLLLIL
ncbi:MAG: hypothetical protein QXR34_10895 [Saccharolobus sp.]